MNELVIFRHLVRELLTTGYVRTSGVVGTLDRPTGLPHSYAGIPAHPLNPSLVSHREHRHCFEGPTSATDSGYNMDMELWSVNRFRGSWSPGGPREHQASLSPCAAGAARTLINNDLVEKFELPDFTLKPDVEQRWRDNGPSAIVRAFRRPEFVTELQSRFDTWFSNCGNSEEDVNACERYSKPAVKAEAFDDQVASMMAEGFDIARERLAGQGIAIPDIVKSTASVTETELGLVVHGRREPSPALAARIAKELGDYATHTCDRCGKSGVRIDGFYGGTYFGEQVTCRTCTLELTRKEQAANVAHLCAWCKEPAARTTQAVDLCLSKGRVAADADNALSEDLGALPGVPQRGL